ncbi:MAG: hypothetical protein ACI840_002712 [Ulvibacter sp.]|jgi:hypothetical protein
MNLDKERSELESKIDKLKTKVSILDEERSVLNDWSITIVFILCLIGSGGFI